MLRNYSFNYILLANFKVVNRKNQHCLVEIGSKSFENQFQQITIVIRNKP